MKKAITFLIIIIFGSVVLINKQMGLGQKKLQTQTDSRLKKYARDVLTKCQNQTYKPGCYEKEIPGLMDYISMEDAFKVTSIVQNEDKNYPYCHVLGHKLSAREIDKDPSKWKEVVSRCPSGVCSNGCIHGGFQERFRAESFTEEEIQNLKPDLTSLCEQRNNWRPTGLEQASCYHALGHLTMYLTSADTSRAIKLCRETSIKKDGRDFSRLCFDGSFMQIYQPLEPEDFALIKGKEVKAETVELFCARFDRVEKSSCLSESWPLFGSMVQKPDGLVEFCSKEDRDEQDRCYTGMIYVLTAQFNFDTEKIHKFCLGLPKERQARCFADASSRMIETDYRNIKKSVDLCLNSQNDDKEDICLSELLKFSTYNYHTGSAEFLQLCQALPGNWQQRCLNKS